MTVALEGGEWSAPRPGRTLPPGKTRYPLYRRLCGPQGRSGRAENLVPTAIRSRTVQPVVIRYTDWATRRFRIIMNMKLPMNNACVWQRKRKHCCKLDIQVIQKPTVSKMFRYDLSATSLVDVSNIPEQTARSVLMTGNKDEGSSFLRNIPNYETTSCHI